MDDVLRFRWIGKYCSYCGKIIEIVHSFFGFCGKAQDPYYRDRVIRAADQLQFKVLTK